MSKLLELRQKLPAKSHDELSFWEPIARNGVRGFTAKEFRQAAIHFKQYGLIQIGRDIGCLTGKTVVEIGTGPSPIIAGTTATKAYGVDPLAEVYANLWDLSGDGVEYFSSEIETFVLPEKVDIVICWNGIDHVRDIETTMRSIKNLLKDDGEFWTFTNTEDPSLSTRYKKNPDSRYAHQFSFNEISLDMFFRSHGWTWVTRYRYEPTFGMVMPSSTGGVLKINDKRGKTCSIWAQLLAFRLSAATKALCRRLYVR